MPTSTAKQTGRIQKRYIRRSRMIPITRHHYTNNESKNNNPIVLRRDRRAEIPNLSNFPFPYNNNRNFDEDGEDGSTTNTNGVRFGDFTVLNHNTHPGVIYYFIELRNPLGRRYTENNENVGGGGNNNNNNNNNNGNNDNGNSRRNVRGNAVFRTRRGN